MASCINLKQRLTAILRAGRFGNFDMTCLNQIIGQMFYTGGVIAHSPCHSQSLLLNARILILDYVVIQFDFNGPFTLSRL